MPEKIDITLSAGQGFDDPVECEIYFDPELIGHEAEFQLVAEVKVKDSSPVHSEKVLYDESFKVLNDLKTIQVPRVNVRAYSYSGNKIDIQIHTRVKVDDALIFDTKMSEEQQLQIAARPVVSNDANRMIEPDDAFNFFDNLKAIPPHNQVMTLILAVIGGIIILVNMAVGIHDQMVPEAMTWIYSHSNSDGESQSPFFGALAGSGALGLMIWLGMRHQLRKYMKFRLNLANEPVRIEPEQSFKAARFFNGQSRVPLENITLRIVACNMEKGQYVRGSGTDRRTVSFSEPVRAVKLFEKRVDYIPAKTPLRDYFQEEFSFTAMFKTLYPPVEVSAAHGLAVHWEIQLLHPEFVDQELIGKDTFFHYEDFLAG